MTVWTVHDGTTDSFASLPAALTKRFKSTANIRSHMSFNTSSKVYVVVLENYISKGVFQFELSNPKIRLGYGKIDIQYIHPDSTKAADIQRMFTAKPSRGGDGDVAETSQGALPDQLSQVATAAVTPTAKTEPEQHQSMNQAPTQTSQQMSTSDLAKEVEPEPVEETTGFEEPTTAPVSMTQSNASCF